MNDLNLRVSALKLCAHPKRFAKMRGALVPLPRKWQDSQIEHVVRFAAAESSAEQLIIVREIFGKPETLNFLADVLFVCPLKHPVRRALTKLFSSNGTAKTGETTHSNKTLLAALRQSLSDLAISIENIDVDVSVLNDVFVLIGACLTNFPNGRNALYEEIQSFIALMPRALQRFWLSLSEPDGDLSPIQRNELFLFIQNLLRLHVNVLANYKNQLVPDQCQQLRQIDEVAKCVASHTDTPWDVRSIAGLAIGQNARFFDELDEYLMTCQQLDSFENLSLKAAALLVLQKDDYSSRAEQALNILKSVISQVKAAGNITNLLQYMSKHLHTYSKSLSNIVVQGRAQILYNLILTLLQRFAFKHITTTVDSVRHMCGNILNQVLQHAKAIGQVNIIGQVYIHFERHSMPVSSATLMLEQVVAVMGAKNVVNNCPSIFDKLFPSYLGKEDSVDSLYKCMLTIAHKEETFKTWYQVWCVTLLNAAKPCDARLPAIELLIKDALLLEPNLINIIIEHKGLPFSTKLTAMVTARRHTVAFPFESILEDYGEQVKTSLVGVCDNTRLQALRFNVEALRPSEPYIQFELEAIACYVQHNSIHPCAHVRQIGYGLLQKACKRLKLNLANLIKNKETLNDDHFLIIFVKTMLNMLALNLFPTANYGRRWVSMCLMHVFIKMLEQLQLPWQHMLPPQTIPFLDNCLRDSYEHNKEQAVQLLDKLQIHSRHQPDQMMQLLLSQRPPDSITAAYQLQAYCQAKEVETELPATVLPKHQPRYYAVLQLCLNQLDAGIAQAGSDFTAAVKSNPLYGLLFASRHLLRQLDLVQLAQETLWRTYVEQLLAKCMIISKLMLPVVGSSSPEGHVPKKDTEAEQVEEDPLEVIPQLVLLCAWRSVKEVSNILGKLVLSAPFEEENNECYLLSRQQVTDIGEHFLVLLSEVKHRGAFEQAYVGFTMLCQRFWQSNSSVLNQLPPTWLNEAMQMVSGEAGKELCSTRRSAGMPYMLQALICTELKLGTHSTFHKCMNQLLDVCERREPGPAAATARGHALNIMRALFRCSELADLVGEFISRGVICALDSLIAIEWSERNCATLLLSALVVRIFGVERARNDTGDLHVRNRMTGRIFFIRYPKLFDYFYNGLMVAAAQQHAAGGQNVQLDAMLQLLRRLYPSALEGTESSLNLSQFVPFLQRICSVHDFVARQNASKVLGSFMSSSAALERIHLICLILNVQFFKKTTGKPEKDAESDETDLNHLHGQLLQLLELYRIVGWKAPKQTVLMMYTLCITAIRIFEHNIYIFNAILDILIAIMKDLKTPEHFTKALKNALNAIDQLKNEIVYHQCENYGISPKFYQLFKLHLHRLTVTDTEMIWHYLMMALVKPKTVPPSLNQLTMDLWLYLLIDQSNNSRKTHGLVDKFEMKYFNIDPDVVMFCKTLSPDQVQTMYLQLCDSIDTQRHVYKLSLQLRLPAQLSQLYVLMALLGRLDLTTEELLEKSGSGIEPGLAICITQDVMQFGMRDSQQQRLWLPILRYLLVISSPEQSPYLRYRAAQLIDRLTLYKNQLIATGNVEVIGIYFRLVLQLLVDESELVRSCLAEMVSSCMGLCLLNAESSGRISTIRLMPTVAEKYFLQYMLSHLDGKGDDGNFLISLFNIMVEPFVSAELLDDRLTEEQQQGLWCTEDELEVFNKHESNLYCEGLRVTTQIAKAFKSAFPQNEELNSALDAIETLCSFSDFSEEPIAPRIVV